MALKDDGTVVAWGDNGNGQTLIPVGLSGVQAIAAGIAHTVALREDGSIVAWGWDIYGQTRIPTGLSGVQAVSAGGTHTVVLQGPKVVFASGRPEKFTLTNTGSAPLQIADVRISGENAGDFTVSTLGMLTSIPPVSGQTTFTVTFHPSKSGTKTANLLVKSDDLDEGDYFIWLTGTNNQPQAVGTIPEHEIRIGTPLTVDLSSYFIDPDGGRLSYSLLTNSNSAAITATLTGSALQLSGLAPGLTDITLLASDTPGGSITSTLRVRAVNEFTVPSPAPELTVSQTARLADGSVLVQINAIPGRSYQVETSPNLNQWTPVPLPIQAGATKVQYIDHDAPPESLKRYYRVREISW